MENGYRVILSLGSNLGDRLDYLTKAIELLTEELVIEKISSVYETPPLDMQAELNFYNLCISGKTELNPLDLLKFTRNIEFKLGRELQKGEEYQSRTIDIDIIDYDKIILNDPKLTLPHEKFRQRKFVLIPLKEIVPDFTDPVTLSSLGEIIDNCDDKSSIMQIDQRITVNT